MGLRWRVNATSISVARYSHLETGWIHELSWLLQSHSIHFYESLEMAILSLDVLGQTALLVLGRTSGFGFPGSGSPLMQQPLAR